MTEREKIANILNSTEISQELSKDDIYKFANALIEAGFGDVKEVKMVATRYEMLYNMQARDMVLTKRKACDSEHRAEVAERQAMVLSKWLAEKTRKDYPWQAWFDAAQKQAEKELGGGKTNKY